MRSGVLAPERSGGGGLRKGWLFGANIGDVGLEIEELRCSERMVVARCMFVVSADGGGGRPASESSASEAVPLPFLGTCRLRNDGRMLARQRKHSPVP